MEGFIQIIIQILCLKSVASDFESHWGFFVCTGAQISMLLCRYPTFDSLKQPQTCPSSARVPRSVYLKLASLGSSRNPFPLDTLHQRNGVLAVSATFKINKYFILVVLPPS